jgi:hypothetical protein
MTASDADRESYEHLLAIRDAEIAELRELLTRARGTIIIVLAQLDELTRVLDGRAA